MSTLRCGSYPAREHRAENLEAFRERVRKTLRIEVSQPNPYGREWMAIDANTYDCDCDQDGFFSRSPVGWSRNSREEAIEDLIDQIVERHMEREL